LVERKLLSDLHVSTVSQAIVSEYLASGHYRHQHTYKSNIAKVGMMLLCHFPPLASWTVPNGGTFLWVLPASLPMSEICQQALWNIFIAEGTPFSQDNRATQLLPSRQIRLSGYLEKC